MTGGQPRMEMMKTNRRDSQLLFSLLLSIIITQGWCQGCSGPCQCPPIGVRCPGGVPLVLDGCGCCQVCARQEGEACSDQLPCDARRGLQCDYSSSFPGEPGQCVDRNELGCDVDGRRLQEGQVFQPSCSQLCHCLGGGVTCVPLCSDDLQRPADNCPNPQLVRPPGRCCKEWVCDGQDNSIQSSPPAERTLLDYRTRPYGSDPNCIEWASDWSPCSHSCGQGVSTRTTNRNWACRLQTQTRLCWVRPCQNLLPGLRGLQLASGSCESSFSSPLSMHLEHQGCWTTRAYRPRFCAAACPDGRCCTPTHTRTLRMLFRCPQGRLIQQQVMAIESCSCSISACRQSPGSAGVSWM
ncbi:CCN family member 5-like isoform X2 [Antennarius striatus]|uniref:CCN family member 5-like isoform X2 n=1 Tax=Antennarius striatus TaxID=241820 RepID=UPI0035B4A5E8